MVAPGPAAPGLARVRAAGPGPGRRHRGPGPRPRAQPLEPHLPLALVHLLAEGTVRVRPGDRVAACGNSGNSTEPHLHFQLIDHPSVLLAAGLPLRFARYRVEDAERAGVPRNLEPFTAPR